MCDYSLEHLESRPAKVGDKLVSTLFTKAVTRGLSAPDAPNVAVCLRPGTELAFDRGIEADTELWFAKPKIFGHKTAIFRQIKPDVPHQHHDALELPDGRVVLLTRLIPGQSVTVLQVPVEERPVEEPAKETAPEAPAEPAPELPKVGGEGAGGFTRFELV
jgi:hypothetical protein